MGNVFIIFGISAVGKSSVLNGLLQRCANLKRIVTCTTRGCRIGEEPDVDYHFITKEKIQAMLATGDALMYDRVYTKEYCVSKQEIDLTLQQRFDAIFTSSSNMLENGSLVKMRELYSVIPVGIINNDFDIVRQRLLERGSDSGASLDERINKMKAEHDVIVRNCSLCIENNDLEHCVAQMQALYQSAEKK